jgi:hypothetical protein
VRSYSSADDHSPSSGSLRCRLAAVALIVVEVPGSQASAWPGCTSFSTQPQAQAYWESHGRPSQADGDHDGKVCESLPGTPTGGGNTRGCTRTGRVVAIGLSRTRYAHILAHARRAIAKGWPRVMKLNRTGATQRRVRLLAPIPTRRGYDRDEYPMAAGRASWSADVEYVPSAENRAAGSVVGVKLRRDCNGTRFA